MAKHRTTPPRGIAPLSSPGHAGRGLDADTDRDAGRPTVQEIAALEVVAAMERTQREGRDGMTRQEMMVGGGEQRDRQVVVGGGEQRDRQSTRPLASRQRTPAAGTPIAAVIQDPSVGNPHAVAQAAAQPAIKTTPVLHGAGHVVELAPRSGVLEAQRERTVLRSAPGLQSMSGMVQVPTPGNVQTYPLSQVSATDGRLIMQREPDSPQAAAFRVLRYRVEQMEQDGLRVSVLAVCAPRPGQGATTVAANLALALSECNRARVCLIEGNLRRPALGGLFNFRPPTCLIERLRADRDRPLDAWCVAELSPSLHVLAVGEGSPRQALVDGPSFGAAVEAMRRAGYRHIVIDGPEVLGIADMNLIEEVVDGVLLVARGGATTGEDLRAAAAQLATKKLRGIVMLDGE